MMYQSELSQTIFFFKTQVPLPLPGGLTGLPGPTQGFAGQVIGRSLLVRGTISTGPQYFSASIGAPSR